MRTSLSGNNKESMNQDSHLLLEFPFAKQEGDRVTKNTKKEKKTKN
jgi:hypothetical protein